MFKNNDYVEILKDIEFLNKTYLKKGETGYVTEYKDGLIFVNGKCVAEEHCREIEL